MKKSPFKVDRIDGRSVLQSNSDIFYMKNNLNKFEKSKDEANDEKAKFEKFTFEKNFKSSQIETKK
jgi:hypothetical protein